MASQARELENQSKPLEARERWLEALKLLPAESTQAEWVRDHARQLALAARPAAQPESRNKWASKLGPLAPLAIALSKAKVLLAVFKLNFLLSLAAFIGVYWALYGPKFGLGFVALIFLHEMGHFIDVKRRGLPAEMPVFLPGLGAYVRWQALGVSQETRAAVSLAGPLAGFLAAAACALVWWHTGNGIWAALARASAWLNVLNLIPVWVLDGGQAVAAIGQTGARVAFDVLCGSRAAAGPERVFPGRPGGRIPHLHQGSAPSTQPGHDRLLHRRPDGAGSGDVVLAGTSHFGSR